MPVLVAVGSQDKLTPLPGAARWCTVSVSTVVWPAKGRQGAVQTDLERVPRVRKQLCDGAGGPGGTHRTRALRALPCGPEQLGLGRGKAPVEASREVDSQGCRDCLPQPRRG